MHSRGRSRFLITIGLVAVMALAAWTSPSGASSGAGASSHAAGQCSSSDNGPRNPANPLDTAGFSGTNPLAGADLFVESPWQYGGDAADAIANEVGLGSLSKEQSGTLIFVAEDAIDTICWSNPAAVSGRAALLKYEIDHGDGNGPLLNPHPVTQGIEQLCNPPGRGLGPKPGASNGQSYGLYSPYLDGFVWVMTPGESAAPTCPGRSTHYAASGIFDEGIAIGYASRANNRIGPSPRFKSRKW